MKRLVVMVLVGGFFSCSYPTFAQYAEAPYYDAVTVAFKKRCTEEGFESCLSFLMKDQDKYTRAEVFQRLTESEKDRIDSYLKAQAEAAEEAAKAEAEARQRAAEDRQQALRHTERMQELKGQQRVLERLRAEIRHAQKRQRRRLNRWPQRVSPSGPEMPSAK